MWIILRDSSSNHGFNVWIYQAWYFYVCAMIKTNPVRLVLYAGLQSYLGKNFVWNLDVCIAGIHGCGFPDIKSGRQGVWWVNMKPLKNTTWTVWNPVNNGINYLSTAAGFPPSTVGTTKAHSRQATNSFTHVAYCGHPFLTSSLDSLILCLFHATNEQTRRNKHQQGKPPDTNIHMQSHRLNRNGKIKNLCVDVIVLSWH